jgi:hypothetical protein
MVRDVDGSRIRAFFRLLVHGFSCCAARNGRQFHDRGAPYTIDRCRSQDVFPFSCDSAWNDRGSRFNFQCARSGANAFGGRIRTACTSVFRGGKGIIPPKYDSAGNPVLRNGQAVLDYDLATPMMLIRFFPSGLLGIGLCALIASFMSGIAYGLATRDSTIYEQHSLGVNVNLWWGAVMLLFGVVMLLLFRTRMRKPNGGSTQDG